MNADTRHSLARSGVLAARVVQVALALLAAVAVVGGLSMNVLAFAALGVFALCLLGFAGLVEVVVVRPLGRRA